MLTVKIAGRKLPENSFFLRPLIKYFDRSQLR